MTHKRNGRAARIAALNDRLRRNPRDRSLGEVLISAGLNAQGEAFKATALATIAAMTRKDFKPGNDPHGERDFNSFSVDGRLCLFKIDYFAKDDLRRPSEDPADSERTTRVMTVMLAEDY